MGAFCTLQAHEQQEDSWMEASSIWVFTMAASLKLRQLWTQLGSSDTHASLNKADGVLRCCRDVVCGTTQKARQDVVLVQHPFQALVAACGHVQKHWGFCKCIRAAAATGSTGPPQ